MSESTIPHIRPASCAEATSGGALRQSALQVDKWRARLAQFAVMLGNDFILVRHNLATAVLGPVLLYQGKRTRRSIPKLKEPPGARGGTVGSGPPLRLMIVGDSAAAGVGAAHQNEALLGQITALLRERFTVHFSLRARTGATTATTLRRLKNRNDEQYDIAISSLGVNDVIAGCSMPRWRDGQRQLHKLLVSEFGVQHHIVCGLPPVIGFPSLPQPLRWYLGKRAAEFSAQLKADTQELAEASFLNLDFTRDISLMASDGFHPGPGIYSQWADRVCEMIERSILPTL